MHYPILFSCLFSIRNPGKKINLVERLGVWELGWGIGSLVIGNQVLECRTVLNSWGQGLEAPELVQEGHNTGVSVLATVVATLFLDKTLSNPWGDEKGWDTNSQAGEVKGHVETVRCNLGVEDVVTSGDVNWGWDVVGETTVLIKGKNEEGFIPLWRVADCLVDSLDKGFSEGDWGGRVE